jgi:hypothetical protein
MHWKSGLWKLDRWKSGIVILIISIVVFTRCVSPPNNTIDFAEMYLLQDMSPFSITNPVENSQLRLLYFESYFNTIPRINIYTGTFLSAGNILTAHMIESRDQISNACLYYSSYISSIHIIMITMIFVILIVKGIILGCTAIIPGISIGTMALVLDVYGEAIDSFTIICNIKKWSKQTIIRLCKFFFPLAIGIVIAMITLATLLTFLLDTYPTFVHFGFIGIILGSIPYIYKKHIKKYMSIMIR